jgi:hypothetical protein
MKKTLLLTLFATLFSLSGNAQLTTRIASERSLLSSQYACGSASCVTRAIEHAGLDSTLLYVNTLIGVISGAVGWQGVLNAGNVASDASGGTNSFALQNSALGTAALMGPDALQFRHAGDFLINIDDGSMSAQPSISWYDYLSGNYVKIRPNTLTGIRNVALLDEDGSTGIVYHTTATPITVGPLAVAFSFMQATAVGLELPGNNPVAELINSGGSGFAILKDVTSPYFGQILTGLLSGTVRDSIVEKGQILVDRTSRNLIQNAGTITNTTGSMGNTITDNSTGHIGFYTEYNGTISQIGMASTIPSYHMGTINCTGLTADHAYWLPDRDGTFAMIEDVADTSTILRTLINAKAHPGGSSGNVQFNNGGVFDGTSDVNYASGTLMLASSGVPTLLSAANGITFQNAINIQTTANSAMGQATLSSGTVTINNNLITATSEVIAWYAAGGLSTSGAMSTFYVFTRTAGVSFVLQGRNAATGLVNNVDNSTVNYVIIN